MGACHGCGCRGQTEVVDLLQAPHSRERWTRKVGRLSPLVREMLFSDGKVLTDYAVFIRDKKLDLMRDLWMLSIARFAPNWRGEEQVTCATLAQRLDSTWAAYLESPQGYSNLEDLKGWHKLVQSEQDLQGQRLTSRPSTLDSVPEAPIGIIINEEHSRYVFAVSAMLGIHAATICHKICENATAASLGNVSFEDVFQHSFSCLRYVRCLQNSCFTYRIPAEGSAYSPPTKTLTGGQLDAGYFIDDFCPQLFSQLRHLCGITNDQYFKSICRADAEFVEFCSTSRSGQFFFFSQDGRYLLKTAKRFEAEALLRILPDMIHRFRSCPESLLGRYLGLYRVYGDSIDCDVLFFVMLSVTQHSRPIHYTYDLKGCLGKHRKAQLDERVKKDLNWLDDFQHLGLCPADAELLLKVYIQDVEILVEHTIIDYSILLQVHDRHAVDMEAQAYQTCARSDSSRASAAAGTTRLGTRQGPTWASQLPTADTTEHTMLDIGPAGSAGPRIPGWLPRKGILSSDGRYLYTMGLIDLLVPWTWRAKMEVTYYEAISCGRGYEYSRQSPTAYAKRHTKMMMRMCGRVAQDESDDEDGEMSESSG